jgi:hypothetical protein
MLNCRKCNSRLDLVGSFRMGLDSAYGHKQQQESPPSDSCWVSIKCRSRDKIRADAGVGARG